MRRWNTSGAYRWISRSHLLLAVALLCLQAGTQLPIPAQEKPAPQNGDAEKSSPIGQFLTVSGTLDDALFGRITSAALGLQSKARQERRRGILVLQIGPGSSPFHQIQGLAKFLTTEVPGLTTVAWVPSSVTGSHTVLALACQEIVMQQDAELGDISLGTPLDNDEQSFVINLVNRRHNKKVNEALALGMLDRQKEVLWVQLEMGEKPNATRESRVISRAGRDDLAKSGVQILDVKTIKEAGTPGVFTGNQARGYNILAMHLAETRDEVATLYKLPREALREDPGAGSARQAMIIKIDDVIEPILEQFVLRQIDRAIGSGVNLLIFDIESPGGVLLSSLNLANAIADLQQKKVRTVAYVPKQALSGAAIISLGADEIYLHPNAQFGDAGPIEIRDGQQFERAPEKILSVLKDSLKTLAERKRRPVAVCQAMADRNLKVFEVTNGATGQVSFMTEDEIHLSNGEWTKGRQVPESGGDMLLTVNGKRAHELQLAEPAVADFNELKTRLGIAPDVNVAVSARTWVDTMIFLLNTGVATTLLFIIGIMCIYFELHFPTGLFGIMACVCFGLFFWSRFLGGTAGWLEVTLFLLGAGCLAIEIFVTPGFGVFGVSGILLCLFSIIMASQTFIIPASAQEMHQLVKSVGTLSGAIVGVVVLAALFSRYLPSIPLFNDMILTPPGAEEFASGPKLRPELAGGALINPVLERDSTLVGKQGTALTVLRPAGKAQIGEELIDVVSEGPFISAGRPVEIVQVIGNRVVVREMG